MATRPNPLRLQVFLPAFLLILATIAISFIDNDAFIKITTAAKDFMLAKFGWLFSITGLVSLLMVVAVYVSPLGNVKIGGKEAKPMMGFFAVTSIVLCTTIAAGILFWGTAEPLYHYAYPPSSLGIPAKSPESAQFALETLYLHWTFIPYAIYFVPTAVFAFAYYNMKRPFSIGSQAAPMFDKINQNGINLSADIIILFAISFAMASSFATSVVNVGSGLNHVFGIDNGKGLWTVLTILGTVAFVISAGTGLFKGIKYLSQINAYVYIVIVLAMLLMGPTIEVISSGTEAFGSFVSNIFSKALFTGAIAGDGWAKDWTIFYWSNWMAWAPITGIFLARLAYGYTLRQVILINFILPSLFSMIWMTILGGTALHFQMSGTVDLLTILNEQGYGAATYAVLEQFNLATILSVVYLFAVFISFVTATDSAVSAMASVSTKGISDAHQEAPLYVKVLWGGMVGAVSLIFISSLGIDGIKMLSYLGGLPALALGIVAVMSLMAMIKRYKELDKLN